jgi:hypothetical protein
MTTTRLDDFQREQEEIKANLATAKELGQAFMAAIGVLPPSLDRTRAHGYAEDAIAHIQKLIFEYE